MTGELTLLVLRLAFLAVLWIFVFSVIYALRSDLFGTRASEYQRSMAQSRQHTFGASQDAQAAAAAPVQATAPAPRIPASAPLATPQAAPAPAPAARPSNAPGQRASRLVITSGPKRGTELSLRGEPLSIGRSPASDLVIQDDYSSTNHARLLLWNDTWMIQDLDSTNGTYVNGRRVSEPVAVGPGTPIRIGTTTFELR